MNELEQLRQSEKHYRTLLDDSSDPIFSFLPDGTYRYVNKAFATGVGKSAEDIIGFRIWDVFSQEEADKRFVVVKKVFAEGIPIEIEVKVPLPNEDTYYLTTAKPIFDEEGTVESVICTSKNITKRKRAEIELQEKNERLTEALKEIKQLSGLLPICSSCHQIRDEKGGWDRIERYIQQHSEATFSHTLCPTCAKELYPDLDINLE